MRDRGVRIEAVGIGSGFEGGQLKEIATHPAQDHVLAVSKYELLPMIRPLLTFRMCRGKICISEAIKPAILPTFEAYFLHIILIPRCSINILC